VDRECTTPDEARSAPGMALDAFWPRLRAAGQSFLMLDYDGTLAAFTPDRNQAWPYPGVNEALAAIVETRTRVVITSGRQAQEVVRLLPVTERLEVWGCHGLERRGVDGTYELGSLTAETIAALAEAERLAEEQQLGIHLESKPGCLALHWRGLPPAGAAQLERMGHVLWHRFDGANGLGLHTFDGGLELRSELANKSRAVHTLLEKAEPDFALAYLGDDETDEDAFAALPEGALGVLVRPEWRATRALAWLKPPEELLAFLRDWTGTLQNSAAKAAGAMAR
jgi:trehalose 6-phosphate phosphatase